MRLPCGFFSCGWWWSGGGGEVATKSEDACGGVEEVMAGMVGSVGRRGGDHDGGGNGRGG